tara:strand:+ start:166 stop:1272 length:1107 start_codon:yes stop_codon:yes gene_type:complete
MSKSYTPGLKIIDKTQVAKNRLLPLSGNVHVNKNDQVDSDCIVASTEIPGNVQMVNVANQLNIDPEETSSTMIVSIGDDIKKGQVIAKSKGLFGFFQSETKSPLDGKVGNVSNVTGQVIISEPPFPIKIDAYISGKVSNVFDKEGVEISARGTFIQGIIGVGGEKKGTLKIIENNNCNFNEKHKDCIIVLDRYLSHETYIKAFNAGIKGIVCGGIDYMSLSKILGYPLGVAITGMEEVTTVVVTEGFGDLEMADNTLDLLKKYNNQFCSINGATQIRAGVLRPEIFISSKDNIDVAENFNEEDLIISVGSQVRIIREPHFGKIGKVSELPSDLVQIDTETMSRVAKIIFDKGESAIIPRANLEVILSD